MFQQPSPSPSSRPLRLRGACLTGILSASLLMLAAEAASAQANLTFSGGSGSPLTISLAAPVTYTVDVDVPNFPVFLFDATGFTTSFGNDFTGTLTYTINGSTPFFVNVGGAGSSGGAVTSDDLSLFSSASPLVTAGDVLVLRAGTITTTQIVSVAAPTSGTFATFLTSGAGNRISPNAGAAVAAPEPESLALLLTASVPVVGFVCRRKKR